MMINDDKILVAIYCITYNHEPYIRECLEGFVMQKTNFKFVAIVHDDASTDKTAEIVREYEAKYPEIIMPIYETENQYSKNDGSLDRIMNEAVYATSAKYVAMCEGDDYWTDTYKLQKQVDILEKDETLMACVTNCSVVDDKGNTTKEIRGGVVKNDIEGRYNLRQFFENCHQYPTLSVVYRNNYPKEVWEKTRIMSNPYLSDWTSWIALHCFGDFYFLNEVTCAYRVNPNSVTHYKAAERRVGLAKENFRLYPAIASILPDDLGDIKKDLIENKAWLWYDLAHAYFNKQNYFKALWCIFRCVLKQPSFVMNKKSIKTLFRKISRKVFSLFSCFNKTMIVFMDGGICSQINQYVMGQLFAEKGFNVLYDLTFFDKNGMDVDGKYVRNFDLLKLFPNIEFKKAKPYQVLIWSKLFRKRAVDQKNAHEYLEEKAPCYFAGYYSLPDSIYSDLGSYLPEMKFESDYSKVITKAKYSCGIHVRRGDLRNGNVYYGDPATIKYFIDSVRLIKSIYPETEFFIFSDEMDYVNNELLPLLTDINYTCIVGNGSDKGYVDLGLLTMCNFQISSVGSFGKYAAFLNRNKVRGLVLMNTPVSLKWAKRYKGEKWIVDL